MIDLDRLDSEHGKARASFNGTTVALSVINIVDAYPALARELRALRVLAEKVEQTVRCLRDQGIDLWVGGKRLTFGESLSSIALVNALAAVREAQKGTP